MVSPSYIILRIQRQRANSVDMDEVAHNEPPHQNLRCLQIQLFSSLVLKELTFVNIPCVHFTYEALARNLTVYQISCIHLTICDLDIIFRVYTEL